MNTILKFGKFKGQDFYSTPKYYQEWLLKQDWFKAPQKPNELLEVQKEMVETVKSIRSWNGYSKSGESAYNKVFELEQMEGDIMYCKCGKLNEVGKRSCGWDCGY